MKIPSTIPMQFWTKLHMTATSQWPSVIREFNLTPAQIEEAAARIKSEEDSRNSWAMSACKGFKKNYV